MIILKTPEEIEKLSVCGQLAAEVLTYLANIVQPGITTLSLDKAAADYMRSLNIRSAFLGYKGYPAHICVSVNEEVVHGIPGSRIIKQGDIVSLDIGIVKDGYYGDTATTIAVGNVPEEKKCLIHCAQEALLRSIEKCVAGARIGDVSHTIEMTAQEAGFSVVRDFVGHGIGTSLHEDPQIPNFGLAGKGPLIRVGMVVAIETMLNAGQSSIVIMKNGWTVQTSDYQPSAHFEHMVAVTEKGTKVLTWQKKSQLK